MKSISTTAWVLVIIGGINWGIIGILGVDIISQIFSFLPVLSKIIYILVGLSAIWLVFKK